MKTIQKIFFIFLSFFLFALSITFAESSIPLDQDGCTSSEWTDEDLSYYKVYEGIVFYAYCKIEDADAGTFKTIKIEERDYGKDKNHLFSSRIPLVGIDPNNFETKRFNFKQYPNGEWAYYVLVYNDKIAWMDDIKMDMIDVNTLEYLDGNYFKDKNNVYKIDPNNRSVFILPNADPAHFYFGYAVEDGAVYWYGKKIEEADADTFKVRLEWSNEIATDKNNVYEKGYVAYGVDVESFQVHRIPVGNNTALYAKVDKDNFYNSTTFEKEKSLTALKNEYPAESTAIDTVINEAIQTYQQKYPNYTPHPATPPVLFSDIPFEHELWLKTKQAKEQGWINGYPDGTFKPEKTVNRVEFAKMLTMAFNKGDGKTESLKKFPDVKLTEWYIPYLSKAVELGMMAGYPDGTMKPGNTIIKAEALKMTLEILGKYYPSQEGEPWYEKYRRYAEEHFPSLTFLSLADMGKEMTRGECVELILAVME